MTKHKLEIKETKDHSLSFFFDRNYHKFKNQLQKCIDIVFSEFNSLFKSKYSRPYIALLKKFGNAHSIAGAHLTHLKNIISFNGKGRTLNLGTSHIKNVTRNSIGENNNVIALKIMLIEFIERQLNNVDKKIEESAKKLNSPIFSISGIGIYTRICILSGTGDIRYFDSSLKIVSFSGMDPSTYQSGQYSTPTTALSKRGSRYLRKALYQCILAICRFNPGKSHRCTQNYTIRKLLRAIHKLLSENVKFDAELLK